MEALAQTSVQKPKRKSIRLKLKKYYNVEHPVHGNFFGRLTFLSHRNNYAEFEVMVDRTEFKFIPASLSSCRIKQHLKEELKP
jgi:hypothetical protein